MSKMCSNPEHLVLWSMRTITDSMLEHKHRNGLFDKMMDVVKADNTTL